MNQDIVNFQGGNSNQGGKVASDVGRQIRQADVMLKSAVLLTKRWWWWEWLVMIILDDDDSNPGSDTTVLLSLERIHRIMKFTMWIVNFKDPVIVKRLELESLFSVIVILYVWNSLSGNFTFMWLPTASNFTDG